ncbi:MarR family winged helix-turn-helix transcriptional regulator [Cellulomonas sp. C5510]|uniref:MarR family winged helix-turn-helix transcriptional regulator n=1 Tax=Cellulomonas sp. C5510 TaxID=2871170 RepID=UPI001C97C956|nr:MarR family winged helix-turn-helix transcriptional regulator [Cellulomonas sp. C5510]QZN87146.1 MarR family winged helix-turn-helix transcriptional regulator [Cellulomonas sp. C5510]
MAAAHAAEEQVPQDATWRAYLGLSREFFTALERRLGAEAGVSVADLELLEPLLAAGETGLRAKDLAAAAEWQDSRVSHQLRRMELRGLVTRSRDRQDARGTVVTLTEPGVVAARAARSTRRVLVGDLLLGPLDAAQVRSLEEIAALVRARVAAAGLGR